MSHWPCQPAWFSNLVTVTEYRSPPVSAAPAETTQRVQTMIDSSR